MNDLSAAKFLAAQPAKTRMELFCSRCAQLIYRVKGGDTLGDVVQATFVHECQETK